MLIIENVTAVVWSPVWSSTVFFVLLVAVPRPASTRIAGQVGRSQAMTPSLMKYLKPATLDLFCWWWPSPFHLLLSNPTYTTIAIFALAFAAAARPAGISSRAILATSAARPRCLLRYRRLHPGHSVPALAYHWRLDTILADTAGWAGCGGVRDPAGRHCPTHATPYVCSCYHRNILCVAVDVLQSARPTTNGSTGLEGPLILEWGAAVYNLPFYYVALVLVLAALVVSWLIRSSKFGLGLLAIRDDEDRARGLGVRTGASKPIAFVISAVFRGYGWSVDKLLCWQCAADVYLRCSLRCRHRVDGLHGRRWNTLRARYLARWCWNRRSNIWRWNSREGAEDST